jgi:hypothetical protein
MKKKKSTHPQHPEKYIHRTTPAGHIWNSLLDNWYPDAGIHVSQGQTFHVSIGPRNFQRSSDGWKRIRRTINPAWRSGFSFIIIYGPALHPAITYLIRCPNSVLWKQAKLRKTIRAIIKSETGVPLKSQCSYYAGVDPDPTPYKGATRFHINPDLSWAKGEK